MSLRLCFFPPLASLLLLSTTWAACGGDDDDDGDGTSESCQQAVDHSDLEWIQANIFTPSCALSAACHQGNASSANGLNLEAGNSRDNLVGVAAEADDAAGLNRVEPGDPNNSYLLIITGGGPMGVNDPRIPDSTGPMPENNELLCDEKLAAISRWIDSL